MAEAGNCNCVMQVIPVPLPKAFLRVLRMLRVLCVMSLKAENTSTQRIRKL